MIKMYLPKKEELWFRELFLSDKDTVSYNHAWGGTIAFPMGDWDEWYNHWVINANNKRFYRYLVDANTNEFVGEVAYHFDGKYYLADIIVHFKYRGRGFGKEGLNLLCEYAKSVGIKELYDDIAIDNPAIKLFLDLGFKEEYRTDKIIMLKKCLF